MKRRTLPLIALAFLFSLSPAYAGLGRWTAVGPGGGTVHAVALDPGEPSVLLVAAGEAGIYRSMNGAGSWEWSGTGLAGEDVRELAFDPQDPSLVFAGTGFEVGRDGKVFRSLDGGRRWQAVLDDGDDPALRTFQVLAVAPGAPATVFAADPRTLWRSTDGGETWSVSRPGFSNIADVVVDPSDPSTVYVADFDGVWKSTDGGGIWERAGHVVNGGDLEDLDALAIAPSEPETLYASASGSGISYRSTDGGSTWQRFHGLGALGGGFRAFQLAVSPTSSSTVYVAGTLGVSVSRDGGETWSGLLRGLPESDGLLDGTVLAIHPGRPRILYLGTLSNGIYKTSNGGKIWKPTSQVGLTAGEVTFLRFDARNPNTLYGGFSGPFGGLLRSRDLGRIWAPFAAELDREAPPMDLAAVPRPPGIFYAATRETAWKSTNGGNAWQRLELGSGVARAVAAVSRQVVLAAPGCGVLRSTDGGARWSEAFVCEVPNPNPFSPSDELLFRAVLELRSDPTNPATIYAQTLETAQRIRQLGLYQSTDGGVTWRLLLRDGHGLAIDPRRTATLYTGRGNEVLRSTDRGGTWEVIAALPSFVNDLAVDSATPSSLLAATAGSSVLRSVDGGRTWSAASVGLKRIGRFDITTLEAHPSLPHLFYALASEGGLFEARFP